MVIWKTNPTYGVQRKTEVTNPNMSSNTSQHHFVAPLWWTPDSSSDWAEVGWTELSPDIGDQWIYSWTTANQWARYPYPIDHGMQIRYAIVPMDGLCGPTETGCVVALKLYWGGDWVLLAMANQLGSNHETVSMGYEWYGATAFHGEVAGAPSGYKVNNFDAQLRDSTGTWSAWSTQATTRDDSPPYELDVTTNYTLYNGKCLGDTCS